MWLHITFIHCPSIPIGYSKNYYPIIMIVHSWNNLIFIFDKVVYQQIFLCLVRLFKVYLIWKSKMLHIEGYQIQLVIEIINSFFRALFFSSIQWCSEPFWFMFFPAEFTTWFLQYILVSFFDTLSYQPNVLTTGSDRFNRHLCLSDSILMLKEYIGLNLFTVFVFLILLFLLVIVFFSFRLEKQLILVLLISPVPHL